MIDLRYNEVSAQAAARSQLNQSESCCWHPPSYCECVPVDRCAEPLLTFLKAIIADFSMDDLEQPLHSSSINMHGVPSANSRTTLELDAIRQAGLSAEQANR